MPLPSEVEGLAHRPEARNLVGIYAALTDTDHASVLREHAGQGFGPFKSALTELLVEKLAPIAAATGQILSDQGALADLLRSGAERAAAIAEPIVSEAERLVGFAGLRQG
jgi:tryptophanyl-tRNA synthetase